MKLSVSVKLACLGLDAKKLGQANAGAAAYGDDASTIFWNPAGLRKLKDRELVTNLSLININTDFDKTLATDAIGSSLTGNNGGDIADLGVVPAVFYASPGENFSWGIGLHVPFGSGTEYDSDSIFRYQAVNTDVQVIDINPAIAWSSNSGKAHFGLGVDIQRMAVELSSTVDYGAVCFASVGAVNPAAIPSLCINNGLSPQNADGLSVLEGDSWSFGYNLGVMFDVADNLTFGLSYRSSVDHDLEGDATFANAPALFTGQGLFVDTDIEAGFESPSLTMVAAKWDVNSNWTIAADYSYSTWSSFESLDVDFLEPSLQPNTVELFEWEDVSRYGLGVEYKHSNQWIFRTGVAYDESPISEAVRGPRLPSSNRTWLSLGASYNLASGSSIDAAYVRFFIDDPIAFNRTGTLGDTISGQYKANANVLSFQYTHKF